MTTQNLGESRGGKSNSWESSTKITEEESFNYVAKLSLDSEKNLKLSRVFYESLNKNTFTKKSDSEVTKLSVDKVSDL